MANTIEAAQLARAIDAYADEISILSLDCFDTLLWRTTHAPADVFSELDCGTRTRAWSESLQRQFNRIAHLRDEVTLQEIHQRAYPGANQAALDHYQNQELLAEHRHCFGFKPATELIRKAKKRGLKVIVVSDTYLNEAQLRALIAHAAGESVAQLIDAIFCSSEFGCSKVNGLFQHVLRALKVTPRAMLHVGDNFKADYEAANRAGIRGLHMEQFNSELAQRFRLEASTGMIMDTGLKSTRPLIQLHRAPLAMGWASLTSAAARIGYASLGPLLTAYCAWLLQQLQELAAQHPPGTVRPLFLMRDAYLPMQVFNQSEQAAQWRPKSVDLSRYCAYAASFTDQSSILEYLTELGGTGRFDVLSKQLLFTDLEANELSKVAQSSTPLPAYTEQIMRAQNLQKIITRSSEYATRLCRHLQHHGAVEAGQVLVFCDLGYAGTIQSRLKPVLRDRLRVEVVGRYLLLRDMPAWRSDKSGLFDPGNFDHRTLDALAAYVAVVEQLCAAETPSTVDYSCEGEPIRKQGDLKSRQNNQRQTAQRACLSYAKHWRQAFERMPDSGGIEGLRTSALQVISRLMFTPNTEEIEHFAGFEHDLNLGVDDKVTLFDSVAARNGLLRNGLFYTNNNPRQYLPAEIRAAGMDLSLSVLLLRRFGPDLRHPDFQGAALTLPIIIADERRMNPGSIQAMPTREGYFVASIPIGDCRLSIGLKFGDVFEWVQIHSIDALPVEHLMSGNEDQHRRDLTVSMVQDDITVHPNGLLQCLSRSSFVLIPPPKRETDQSWVMRIVFRPITDRLTTLAPAGDLQAADAGRLLEVQ